MSKLPPSSEEESFNYSDDAFDDDFKFECSGDDDQSYEEDTIDYLTPIVVPEDAAKISDQIVNITFPSLESLTKDQPVEMEPIYFDRFKFIPQFVVDSEVDFSVFCYLKSEFTGKDKILLDISLYIPSLGRVVYNRYCHFSENNNTQRLSPALFTGPEAPTEPIKDAFFSFHLIPLDNLCRHYFNCVGLLNTSMTCYLNSLIQCLFNLKKFREIAFNCNSTSLAKKSKIANAMRVLFTRMQISYLPVSTRDLTTSFGWNSLDLFQQHDVQELTRLLLERLDDVTENSASSLFKGKNEVTIIAGEFKKSHIEEFSDLSLTVNGVSSLEESLSKYYEPDKLTGDDQYQLEDGTKVDAEVQTKVIENPTILSLHLRRFEYSNEMMKVYSRFEYKENLIFNGEEYELLSIITHFGSVRGGHYNAFAKINGFWTNFDDESVRHCEPYEALEQNYGSDNKDQFTAYVLFYGKKGINDIPDPVAPPDVIDNEKERLSNTKVKIMYDDIDTYKEIKVKKNLDSQSFIEELSKETGIPTDKIVVRVIEDNERTKVIENPVPTSTNFFYIDNSPLLPIWIEFWIPDYEIISLGVFHVTSGVDTQQMLGQEIMRMVGMIPPDSHTLTAINEGQPTNNKFDLDCFYVIDNEFTPINHETNKVIDESGKLLYQFARESATNENFALFKENVLKKKKEKVFKNSTVFEEAKLPKYESHLNLLGNEIQIKSVIDFIGYMKEIFSFEFRPFDDPDNEEKKFVLSLSKNLTFDQLLKCISRKISGENDEPVDINRILLFLPDKYFTYPDHRAISKDVFKTIESIGDLVYYQVFDEDMRFINRADVTVIDSSGNKIKRLSVLFPRGKKDTVNELREKLTEILDFDNYYLFYLDNYKPVFIYSLIEDENEKKNYGESQIRFDYKIFAQVYDAKEILKIKHIQHNEEDGDVSIDYRALDEDDVLKLRVLRCDQLLSFLDSPYLPYILFTEKGKKWKDIKEMFKDEEIEKVNRNSKVSIDEEQVMDESESFAVVYTKSFNSFLFENSLLKIKNEIDEFKNERNQEEEEEEEEAEAEEDAHEDED